MSSRRKAFRPPARKIGRSKALLSKYVRELEDELGALLLNRTTRQFSLTEAGHTYYRRATEIVREIDSLPMRCANPRATCAAASSSPRRAPSPTRRSASR